VKVLGGSRVVSGAEDWAGGEADGAEDFFSSAENPEVSLFF
jgi:hypothetical protein